MMRFEIILALSATVLVFGCGGAPAPASAPVSSAPAPPPTPPAANPPTVGNWLITAGSTVPGNPPLTFAGSISQAGSFPQAGAAITSVLHVDGSNCFDPLTPIQLTGIVKGTSLTSAAIDGQVVTFTGNFPGFLGLGSFDGTYKINGGCASGDQGTFTASYVWNIGGDLSGTFTNSAQKTFDVVGGIDQSTSPSSEGTFGITGTATFDTPCFSAATIRSATYPSGSFILGMSVALEFATNNGTLTFLGTLDPDGGGDVSGKYTVSGGGCDGSGTAVLNVTGAWGYASKRRSETWSTWAGNPRLNP